VCYAFVRLGEVSGQVPEDVRTRHPEVPWRTVRQYRNFMVHVYKWCMSNGRVNAKRVFKTVRDDVPALLEALRRVRSAYPG